jgi:CBS domain containing-hemolysin-like protein
MELLLILLAIVLLVLLQGFFSGAEMALVHADRLKLNHAAEQGHAGARLVLERFQRPEMLLGTTLVGTNISIVTSTTLASLLMIELFGPRGDLLAFLVFTPLFLVFGEVVPKSVYQQKANVLAPIVIYPLRLVSWLLYPVVYLFSHVARLAARLAGIRLIRRDLFSSREQIRSVIDMAEIASEVDLFDRERIRRVIRLADATAGQLMVPVTDMVSLNVDQTTPDAVSLVRRHGYFRLPVFEKEQRVVHGIAVFSVWDLMDPAVLERPLDDFVLPAFFVVPQHPVNELLPVLGRRPDHMAMVVDEFGSAEGMITLEDVHQEVVGEAAQIGRAHEGLARSRLGYEVLGEEQWRMDGRLPLVEADDVLNVKLPLAESHTVGGLLIARLRHLPEVGESIVESGYRFTVEDATDSAVKSVRVEPAGRR